MNENDLKNLLTQVKSGSMALEAAVNRLKKLPFNDLGFAKIDTHREIRTGIPEVIFCQGKTMSQIVSIVKKMSEYHSNILGTRLDPKVFGSIQKEIPNCHYHEAARVAVFYPRKVDCVGKIAVVCAGTSDIPVAEEACVVAETLGNNVSRIYDVGVAGIHRLLDSCRDILDANVAVVAAGMEGALASVVGGLVSCPVIGVPTSIGYGTSFGGVTALLSMLNSCASGVSVVNIDNGFGAACQASLINKLAVGHPTSQA